MRIGRDSIIALGMLAATGFAWQQSAGFPAESGVWPRAVLAIIAALSGIVLVLDLVRPRLATSRALQSADADDGQAMRRWGRLAALMLWMVAFVAAIPVVGFHVAAFVGMAVYLVMTGGTTVFRAMAIALATAAGAWVLAVEVMQIPLPPGVIF